MKRKEFSKRKVINFVIAMLFAFVTVFGINAKTASAKPAQSISRFEIVGYGYDANGSGNGWKASYTGTISRANLHDLWVNTYQVGYGRIDFVKIDGVSVAYRDDKKAGNSGEVTMWRDTLIITDNNFVSNLSSGRHTITVQCSTTNTFPSRTLSSSASFDVA